MKKYLFTIVFIPALLLISGCNQQSGQPKEENTFKSEKVEFKGKISITPEQHMIEPQNDYPYMDYFDTLEGQFVIYTKEKINCTGEVLIKGKSIKIEGTSKKPGSDEVYTEEQILVNSFECKQEEKPETDIISNKYESKIVYTNDLAQADKMRQDCSERNGKFNTCGSPCAPDAEVCIEVCAYTCELSEAPAPLTAVIDTNTDDWLSYSNNDLGFSIKYPPTLNKKEGEGAPVAFSVWGPTQQPETEFYDGINISFNKGVYEGTQSFESFINTQLETEREIAESVSQPLPVTIGGKTAYRVDIVSLGTYSNYYIPLDASYYLLISVMAPDPTNQGYTGIVNNMLESITFTVKGIAG